MYVDIQDYFGRSLGVRFSSSWSFMLQERRSRIGVLLTNCHLARSGLPTYRCDPDQEVTDCTCATALMPFQ